jgi:hypothetical protein
MSDYYYAHKSSNCYNASSKISTEQLMQNNDRTRDRDNEIKEKTKKWVMINIKKILSKVEHGMIKQKRTECSKLQQTNQQINSILLMLQKKS